MIHFDKNVFQLWDYNYPNLSLFYYKYFPRMIDKEEKKKKNEYLKRFIGIQGNKKSIENRIAIIKRIATNNGSILRTVSRFICGTGYTSTVEWGMNFDWTSGMPYLPGSSLKGSLLSYMEFLNGDSLDKWDNNPIKLLNFDTEFKRTELIKLFGPQNKEENPDSGGIVFFDVFPVNGVKFEVDVITPHHKKYYTSSESNSVDMIRPADTENPEPILFLTIAKGVDFLFAFRVRDEKKVDEQLTEKLTNLIIETGENFGFGAKTSSGYGYFEKM